MKCNEISNIDIINVIEYLKLDANIAKRYLPRSARARLRTGSLSNQCAWRAHARGKGDALPPLTRAARTSVPKRIRERVPDCRINSSLF